ncbi:hypothetical protein J5N97_018872 [Dioscorea zingiberensis]|uniref:PGG domain-containing protein n=1 Tax=Dioscorea zingiberensis TaxID=325984 RepID=A0A9D5CDU7_9LILI|nr:hypothetical protein J5N97_018872 [Dioscorea zingiberensis]
MSQTETMVEVTSPPKDLAPPPQEQQQQQQEQRHRGWEGNESSTLLVVATLIIALTYQIGTNPPGGFWQEDANGHEAGSPIMRDKHRKRYWLFMTAAWVGFGDSMLLTLWLLTGAPVNSRRVRWSFVVAYSSLQLTYITAMHGTSLVMDLLTWAGIMFVLFLVIGFEKNERNKLGSRCLSIFENRRLVNPF